MKNNLIKIIMLLLMILLVFSNCVVYADDEGGEDLSTFLDPTVNPDEYKPYIQDEPELTSKAGSLLGIINVAGVFTSIIALCIIGIKYLLGSVEEKADYKKALVPYVIGIILLAACTTIPNIIYNVTTEILK